MQIETAESLVRTVGLVLQRLVVKAIINTTAARSRKTSARLPLVYNKTVMSALKFQFLFSFSNRRRLAAFCLVGSLLLSISVSRAQQPGADSAGVHTGLPKNAVIATVYVGLQCLGIAVSPDNGTVYAANPASGSVEVIDATNYQVKTAINTGFSSLNLALSPDGKVLYDLPRPGLW